jgi:hypothetical protein
MNLYHDNRIISLHVRNSVFRPMSRPTGSHATPRTIHDTRHTSLTPHITTLLSLCRLSHRPCIPMGWERGRRGVQSFCVCESTCAMYVRLRGRENQVVKTRTIDGLHKTELQHTRLWRWMVYSRATTSAMALRVVLPAGFFAAEDISVKEFYVSCLLLEGSCASSCESRARQQCSFQLRMRLRLSSAKHKRTGKGVECFLLNECRCGLVGRRD